MRSPFDILRIEPDADDEEIKRAYRRRVKEAHPDHGGSAQEFRRVRAAYEQVKSGEAREHAGAERPDIAERGETERHGGPTDRGDASGSDDEDAGDEAFRVEYLNYEVLDDYGWALDDDDLFEKASAEGLDPEDHGRILVEHGESLLEAAENRGFAWPYACRGGACANCAVALVDGEMSMPVDHILPSEMTDRGIRLSCVGAPITGSAKVVYNVKHLPDLDDLRLPPRPFRQAHAGD